MKISKHHSFKEYRMYVPETTRVNGLLLSRKQFNTRLQLHALWLGYRWSGVEDGGRAEVLNDDCPYLIFTADGLIQATFEEDVYNKWWPESQVINAHQFLKLKQDDVIVKYQVYRIAIGDYEKWKPIVKHCVISTIKDKAESVGYKLNYSRKSLKTDQINYIMLTQNGEIHEINKSELTDFMLEYDQCYYAVTDEQFRELELTKENVISNRGPSPLLPYLKDFMKSDQSQFFSKMESNTFYNKYKHQKSDFIDSLHGYYWRPCFDQHTLDAQRYSQLCPDYTPKSKSFRIPALHGKNPIVNKQILFRVPRLWTDEEIKRFRGIESFTDPGIGESVNVISGGVRAGKGYKFRIIADDFVGIGNDKKVQKVQQKILNDIEQNALDILFGNTKEQYEFKGFDFIFNKKENNKMIQINFKTIEVGKKVEKDGVVIGIENTKMYRVPTKAEAVHKYMTEHKIEDTKLLLIQEIEEEWEELD